MKVYVEIDDGFHVLMEDVKNSGLMMQTSGENLGVYQVEKKNGDTYLFNFDHVIYVKIHPENDKGSEENAKIH